MVALYSRGFHVKRVSRNTTRNVGVSTCGTIWLPNFIYTLPLAMDSVKSVLIVLAVLSSQSSCTPRQFVFMMECAAVVVFLSVRHTTKSSACRLFDTCLGTVAVMSFMQIRKRAGDTTLPWGTLSLSLTCLLIIPSTFTLAVC